MEEALAEASKKAELPFTLKEKQKECIVSLVEGKDVFAVLPTGYGKTTIYGLIPHVFEQLGERNVMVLVISPLISLMKDQVSNIQKLNIKSVYVADTVDEGYYCYC